MHSHSTRLHTLEGTKGDKPKDTHASVPLPKLSIAIFSWWENPNLPHPSQQQQGLCSSPSARQSLPLRDPPAAGRPTGACIEHHLPRCSPTPSQQQRHRPTQNTGASTLLTSLRCGVPPVSTSKLLQRGPEPHPALAALLREGDVGVSGGISCIHPVPQTLSHLGRPPAGRTVANQQLYVRGAGVNPGRVKKHVHSKNEVAELQGGTGRWF